MQKALQPILLHLRLLSLSLVNSNKLLLSP
jgi:hypothetical protein